MLGDTASNQIQNAKCKISPSSGKLPLFVVLALPLLQFRAHLGRAGEGAGEAGSNLSSQLLTAACAVCGVPGRTKLLFSAAPACTKRVFYCSQMESISKPWCQGWQRNQILIPQKGGKEGDLRGSCGNQEMPIKSYQLAICAFNILPVDTSPVAAHLDKHNSCPGEPLIPENCVGGAGKGERLRKGKICPQVRNKSSLPVPMVTLPSFCSGHQEQQQNPFASRWILTFWKFKAETDKSSFPGMLRNGFGSKFPLPNKCGPLFIPQVRLSSATSPRSLLTS